MKAFEEVKKALQEKLELNVIDTDKPYVLWVDASGRAVGAVLQQPKFWSAQNTRADLGSIRETVTVGFLSRKLTATQIRT